VKFFNKKWKKVKKSGKKEEKRKKCTVYV